MAIESEYWQTGEAQNNLVLRYIQRLFETGSDELAAGFTAVLTDIVSTVLAGSAPDAAFYDDFADELR